MIDNLYQLSSDSPPTKIISLLYKVLSWFSSQLRISTSSIGISNSPIIWQWLRNVSSWVIISDHSNVFLKMFILLGLKLQGAVCKENKIHLTFTISSDLPQTSLRWIHVESGKSPNLQGMVSLLSPHSQKLLEFLQLFLQCIISMLKMHCEIIVYTSLYSLFCFPLHPVEYVASVIWHCHGYTSVTPTSINELVAVGSEVFRSISCKSLVGLVNVTEVLDHEV